LHSLTNIAKENIRNEELERKMTNCRIFFRDPPPPPPPLKKIQRDIRK
jgi:hypothetical protein